MNKSKAVPAIAFNKPDKINTKILETFSYQGEVQKITYQTQEFSAVCPFSGLPDFATLSVDYLPHRYCLELKSFKLYLVSYRQIGIFQEHATNRIFQDLARLLKPRHLNITTIYNTRGGIDATCVIEKTWKKK